MGRINVTFPIFADSNVQPPDVAAVRICMHHNTTTPQCHCLAQQKSGGGKNKLGCDSTHFLDNGVAAHGNSESSH